MHLDLRRYDAADLAGAAEHYAQHGFILLRSAADLAAEMKAVVQAAMGDDEPAMDALLQPEGAPFLFPAEVRQRLARVATPRPLARALLARLEPVLLSIMGPLVHVSSSFHAQFKGGGAPSVDHGGYKPELQHMEVHGAYLLHQDFTGASIPTSPSAVTLWVALNSCPDWNLRLYPGSHRRGLICNRWLNLDDDRLRRLQAPVDIAAEEGGAVLFNALMLHGTSNAGAGRRVSCDIRFFPLCGFLPSEVHLLGPDPVTAIRRRLATLRDPVLRAPLLEDRLFLGDEVPFQPGPPQSVANWINYLADVMRGDTAAAVAHLERFVDRELGIDDVEVYLAKFHEHPMHGETLEAVRARLATNETTLDPHA